MKRFAPPSWQTITWSGLLAIIVVCALANGYMQRQRREREALIVEKTAALETLRDQLKEEDRTLLTAIEFEKRWRHEDRQVHEMMEDCTSREDFVVRSGSRIAWQHLNSGSPGRKRLALYLPTGMHRLCYAVREQATEQEKRAAAAWGRPDFSELHPRLLKDAEKLALGPAAETYEIILEPSEVGTRLYVVGENGESIHQATLNAASQTRSIRLTTPDVRIAYPSELQLPDQALLQSLSPGERITPATDLAAVSVGPSSRANIRIWIESEALPCLPVMKVVPYMSADRGYSFRSPNNYYSPLDIGRYFLPYDGGECLHIRANFFRL